MFGNPVWFRSKRQGWGIEPASWLAWGYAFCWMGVITAPLVLLLGRQLGPEAIVWLSASTLAFVADVRRIRGVLGEQAERDLLYIGDDDAALVATGNSGLHSAFCGARRR